MLTTGQLEIAGSRRPVSVMLNGRRLPDGHVRATGSTPLLLSEYGIDPPMSMLGLIKVHDQVEAHFELVEPAADILALANAAAEEAGESE